MLAPPQITGNTPERAIILSKMAAGFNRYIPHAQHLGLNIETLAEGRACIRLPYQDTLLMHIDGDCIHTGALNTLIDSAAGLAVFASLDTLASIATLDLQTQYIRPAIRNHDVWCEAHCYALTRNIAFVRCELFQYLPASVNREGETNTHKQLIAHSTASFMRSANQNKTRISS